MVTNRRTVVAHARRYDEYRSLRCEARGTTPAVGRRRGACQAYPTGGDDAFEADAPLACGRVEARCAAAGLANITARVRDAA